jgi:hypothetical protein
LLSSSLFYEVHLRIVDAPSVGLAGEAQMTLSW